MSSFLDNFSSEDNNQNEEVKLIKKAEKSGIKTVEYDIENDDKYYKKKKKRLIIEISTIVVVLTTIIELFIILSKVTVPDFKNQLSEIAEKWGSNNKIQVIEDSVYNNDYLEGYIISQNIKPGTKVAKNTIIKVVISKGYNLDELITIPDLKNMTGSEIQKWIDDNHLTNTTITEEVSKKIERGNLIRYSFDSVTVDKDNFTRSDILSIVISKGNAQEDKNIEVINLVTATKEDATKWCTENNLICKFTEVLSDEYETGKIVSQSKSTGDIIATGSKVTFKVSVGKGITIPDFSKISSDAALTTNAKLDIKIKLIYDTNISYGQLISQSVAAGTRKMETDNRVNLVYSLGKPYFSSIVGTSESELAKLFYEYNQKGVNFTYTIKYVTSDKDKGTIVATSKSNEFVAMDQAFEIQVSKGL